MAFETLIWVRKQKTGNVASRSVLRVLADHAGQDHSCYLRTATIADETDLSEAGVRKALSRLVDAGLVRIFARYSASGGRRSNRYQLLTEGAGTPPPDAEDWAGVREATPHEVEGGGQPGEGGGLNDGEGFPYKEASVVEATPVKAPTARRATRIPDDFQPDEQMRAWYRENIGDTINGRVEHENFCDYWRAQAGANARKLDWAATWRRWMRTAAERAGRGRSGNALSPISGAPQQYKPSTVDQRIAQGLALAEKFRLMEDGK